MIARLRMSPPPTGRAGRLLVAAALWSTVLACAGAPESGQQARPGAAALVAGAFGFAVFAGSIEFPVIRKARGGMTAIEALGTIRKDFFRHHSRWGLGAAALAFILL